MRYPIEDAYDKLVNESPVRLNKKLSPKAFSKHGDQLIMVCNPGFPTIGNCRFYQARHKLTVFEQRELVKKAGKLDLSVIPALNIDLDSLSKYEYRTKLRIANYSIVIAIKPSGNVRVMDKSEHHSVWVKTGKDSPRLTIKAFEVKFFSDWKIDVIYAPPKGALLKLTKEGKFGEEIELAGAIKKSKNNDGLEASLYPIHSDQIFCLGPLAFGGEFGFKIEITGDWQDWEEDDFEFIQKMLDFSDFYADASIADTKAMVQHVNIVSPSAAVGTAGMGMMLSVLWKWYASLPVGEEIIAAPIAIAASG